MNSVCYNHGYNMLRFSRFFLISIASHVHIRLWVMLQLYQIYCVHSGQSSFPLTSHIPPSTTKMFSNWKNSQFYIDAELAFSTQKSRKKTKLFGLQNETMKYMSNAQSFMSNFSNKTVHHKHLNLYIGYPYVNFLFFFISERSYTKILK